MWEIIVVPFKTEIANLIDEQITPGKTKCSGIRQYHPNESVKWGFKMFFVQDHWV